MANIGLHIGLQALLTSQSALDAVGNNVANANTPGYSRQRLEISSSRSVLLRGLSLGGGVQADVVRRTTDALINQRLILQGSARARLEAKLGGLADVEALFGEPGAQGLAALADGFFGDLATLAATPGERVQRSAVLESAGALTTQVRRLAQGVGDLRADTAARVEAEVEQVNTLSRRILQLNREIVRQESSRLPANDLRDQRELALGQLAEIVDIDYHEDAQGALKVTTQGRILVGSESYQELSAVTTPAGEVTLHLSDSDRPLAVRGGRLGGLLSLGEGVLPGLGADLDRYASNLIFELNKVHSTGVPATGSFSQLTAEYAFVDVDGDGRLGDELVSQALPFDVQDGALYVNVTDAAGVVRTTRIDVDTARTTVDDLIAALGAVPGLDAGLDGSGRLQVFAAGGSTFDFGRRLDAAPDRAGTFGGAQASLGAGAGGPYALVGGDTLDLVGPLGAFSVSFDAADFADVANATAAEVAAALNADASFAANGLTAVVDGDRVALQSVAEGPGQSFTVAGGSALGAFGWSAGTTVTGHDVGVAVELGGSYTGDANRTFRFVANGDGTVGTTPGLTVDVVDDLGQVVATLDVGAGYEPGAELPVVDGLTVRVGFGELSATHHDAFEATALADSDTSDVLGALGMNALLVGTDASDIALRADLADDPARLATSVAGAEGDGALLNELLGVQDASLAGLDGRTLGAFYGDLVGDVGFEASSASSALEVERYLEQSLVARREQVSGVNVDEELVNMLQFEQAFATAAQFIQVVNQTQDELLALI